MSLIWTREAKNNLKEIISHIWRDNPAAALKMRARIEKAAAYLERQPFMGRIGAISGTREAIPHPSYRIVYQVIDGTVAILAVVHTARRWPPESDNV